MQKRKSSLSLRRLTLDAVLAALYVVFAVFLTVKTPWFEFSAVSLPILLAACLFGWDAVLIAFVGSFLEQLLSPYGLSLTTPLWMAPVVLMAAFAALGFSLCRRTEKKWPILAIIILSEVLLTVLNTVALYADGYIMQYSVKALHLIALPRAINGGARMLLTCAALPLLLVPLRRVLKK